jgi:hypothetical protein
MSSTTTVATAKAAIRLAFIPVDSKLPLNYSLVNRLTCLATWSGFGRLLIRVWGCRGRVLLPSVSIAGASRKIKKPEGNNKENLPCCSSRSDYSAVSLVAPPLSFSGYPAHRNPLEQCQEKHAPDNDPGWKPVFRPTLRQGKQLDQSSIPRNRTLI